jgi:hypothetical protein
MTVALFRAWQIGRFAVSALTSAVTGKRFLKLAGALLAVVAVVVAIMYVARIRDALSDAESALHVERSARIEAEARVEHWKTEYQAAADRLSDLMLANKISRARIAELTHAINTLDLEKHVHADPKGAAARLDAANRDINRLLEQAGGH